MKKLLLTIIALLILDFTFARNDTLYIPKDSINHSRLNAVIFSGVGIYSLSMSALYGLWYRGYPQSEFHFFNDFDEWQQMDKLGHLATSYYVGKVGYESLRWAGVGQKKSVIYGGTLGLAFLTTIEIFDGFSSEWGFSAGDMTANILGSGIFISQQLAWKQQRILLKWSFHQTEYSGYRPDILGKHLPQNLLKDYNGQTYWLSANISSFLHDKTSRFPRWLAFSFGYGAEGMLGGRDNPGVHDNVPLPHYNRIRKFYLSPDIDLTHIRTKSKTLKLILNTIGFLKFPLPALEYNTGSKFKYHWLFF